MKVEEVKRNLQIMVNHFTAILYLNIIILYLHNSYSLCKWYSDFVHTSAHIQTNTYIYTLSTTYRTVRRAHPAPSARKHKHTHLDNHKYTSYTITVNKFTITLTTTHEHYHHVHPRTTTYTQKVVVVQGDPP